MEPDGSSKIRLERKPIRRRGQPIPRRTPQPALSPTGMVCHSGPLAQNRTGMDRGLHDGLVSSKAAQQPANRQPRGPTYLVAILRCLVCARTAHGLGAPDGLSRLERQRARSRRTQCPSPHPFDRHRIYTPEMGGKGWRGQHIARPSTLQGILPRPHLHRVLLLPPRRARPATRARSADGRGPFA